MKIKFNVILLFMKVRQNYMKFLEKEVIANMKKKMQTPLLPKSYEKVMTSVIWMGDMVLVNIHKTSDD